ncbi:MAG TPA: FkbM family methyltransferase [Desulfomonilaceae bacterium]|nr:FkbM family methyltransferase [Desulfomonilaceae bacterium]
MIGQSTRMMQRAKSVDRRCFHTYLPGLLGPDSTVLDLGANKGEFSREMISRYSCRVFAAEPLSDLRASIALSPGLTLLPFAVGGRNGRARLREFSTRCASLLYEKEGDILGSEKDVEVLDLRSVLEKIGGGSIDLMKVDIEGAEIEMFESASDADLRKCVQITVEFHDFIYPEQSRNVESIKRRLRGLGFLVINFSLDNTDVLFVNAAASGIGQLQYFKLKYITKYMLGIRRRFKQQ